MATNEKYREGDALSLPVKAGTKSGDPVQVGQIMGVAQTNIGDGGNPSGNATVWTEGVFLLPVTGAVANVGDPVYITSAGALTATSSGNNLYGAALATQAGDGTIPVKIHQS